jgi:RecA/RadA recombinase
MEFLSSNDNVKLAVIDSIAALVPEKQLERAAGDEFTLGALSKFMSTVMPKLNNVCRSDPEHKKSVIWLNQIRTDIKTYGAPQKSAGGNAVNHYMDVRITLRRTNDKDRQAYQHTESGLLYATPSGQNTSIEKVGYEVDGMIVKSKVSTAGASRNKFIFRYIANVGIDKQFDLMRTAMETGILQVSGATNTINGDKYRGKEEMFKNILQYEDYIKKNINYSKAVFVSDNTCGSDEMVFIPDDDVSEELKIAA